VPDARTADRAPVLAVFVGGTAGTALRAAVGLAVPTLSGVPVATIGINVVGSFALGLLLATLGRRGPDTGRRRLVRLALGTGMLGGFTTYSTLAVDTATLLGAGRTAEGLVYAVGTVLAGLAAAAGGIRLGERR
jgi:CrcB protein